MPSLCLTSTSCTVCASSGSEKGSYFAMDTNEGFTEKEYGMVRLENVGDVLFQVLLLDNVNIIENMICTDLYTFFINGRIII